MNVMSGRRLITTEFSAPALLVFGLFSGSRAFAATAKVPTLIELPSGKTSVVSAEWGRVRDTVLAWCNEPGNQKKCSQDAKNDLAKPQIPNHPGNMHCAGRLDVPVTRTTWTTGKTVTKTDPNEAELSTWNCNGGTFATFARQGTAWVIKKVVNDPGGD